MKKILLFIITAACFAVARGQQQGVTFHVPEIEQRVKMHVGITAEGTLSQAQLDTITTLSLRGLGISDVRDLLLMGNVRELDLSLNQLQDVGCLYHLSKLEKLNLCYNELEDINLLSFSQADRMTVDISGNYITDLSIFRDATSCCFTIEGVGYQSRKKDYFFSVNKLYITVNEEGCPVINCSAYCDKGGNATLKVEGGMTKSIPADESLNTLSLLSMPDKVTPVTVTYDTLKQTTYIVPPSARIMTAGDTTTFKLPLPDSYVISYMSASTGEFSSLGNTFTYIAAPDFKEADITLTYSEYGLRRGSTTIHLVDGLPGDANKDCKVNDLDVFATIDYLIGKKPENYSQIAADLDGDGKVTVVDITALIEMLKAKRKQKR